MDFKCSSSCSSSRWRHEKLAEERYDFTQIHFVTSEASFPDERLPLRLLHVIHDETLRQRSRKFYRDCSLSLRKRGLNRATHNMAIKWVVSHKEPNIIEILHTAIGRVESDHRLILLCNRALR